MPKKSDQVMDDYGRKPAPYVEPPRAVVLPQGFAQGFQPYAAQGQRVMYPVSGPVLGDAGVDNRLAHSVGSMQPAPLDPAIVSYLQGQPVAAPPQTQPTMSPAPYGVHPAIASAVQRGFVPAYASGGIVTEPTLAMVGEAGPEAIVPLAQAPQAVPGVANGMPPGISAGVQNGFAPQSLTSGGMAPGDELAAPQPVPQPPPVDVPSVTGGSITPQDVEPIAPPPRPDINLGAIAPATDKQVAASNKAYDTKQAKQAAFDATPEGTAQRAEAEQRAALDKERQANADASAAEEAQNAATNTALQASANRQAEQDKIDAQKRTEDQANVDKYTQTYAQQIKDASDYKVDTNRDVGARGMIAIALSGLGDALMRQNGPNAAVQIISAQQDKRIADQWAQKRALGDKANDTKSVLDVYRRGADDDRQAEQIQRAAEATRSAQEIRQIGAQYANPAAKARAEAVAAGLDQKAAAITMSEAQRKAAAIREAQEAADRRAHLGIAYGQLDLARKAQANQETNSDRDFAIKVAQLEGAGKVEQAKALAADHEAIMERGLFMPTGTVNADGSVHREPIVQESGEAWKAPKDVSKELGVVQAGAFDAIKQIDTLREMRKNFGGGDQAISKVLGSPEGRAMMQREAQVIMDLHKVSGINRFSGEVVELSEKILKGDDKLSIDSMRSLMGQLDDARPMVIDQLDANMRGQGKYTGKPMGDYFPDPLKAPPTPTLGEQILHPSGDAPEPWQRKAFGLPDTGPSYMRNLDENGKLKPSSSVKVAPSDAPDIIDNFNRPVSPTIAEQPKSAVDYVHEELVKRRSKK